ALAVISGSTETLAAAAVGALEGESPARVTRTVYLRYEGTDTALPVDLGSLDAMRTAFDLAHRAHFGFSTPDRTLIVESVSVEAVRSGGNVAAPTCTAAREGALVPLGVVRLWSAGRPHDAPVFERAA